MQADAELRLRAVGIRVVTEKEAFALPGAPFLYVAVTGNGIRPAGGYAACVTVALSQNARLERDASVSRSVPTWSVEGFVTGSSTEDIRGLIRDAVDRFANAYLSVNPK